MKVNLIKIDLNIWLTLNKIKIIMIRLINLLKEESFTAINKDSGKTTVFKSKSNRDAAIKAGTHDKKDGKDSKGGDVSDNPKADKPNMFSKDTGYDAGDKSKEEPTKDDEILVIYKNKRGINKTKSFTDKKSAQKFADANDGELGKIVNGRLKSFPKTSVISKGEEPNVEEPKKDSTQQRAGNEQVNKVVRNKAKSLGVTPQKLGKEEYEKRMSQAAVEALTDANFHSESRALIAVLEDNPELAKNPSDDPNKPEDMMSDEYDEWKKGTAWGSSFGDSSDGTDDIAHSATGESSWDGQDSIDAIAFDLKMNGSKELAAKIQSIFNEKNESTTKLTSMINRG